MILEILVVHKYDTLNTSRHIISEILVVHTIPEILVSPMIPEILVAHNYGTA